MALTKKEQEALRKRLKPYAICARKIGIFPGRKWTKTEKEAVRVCVRKMKRTK
jgi:hypothetical protein